MEGEKSETSVKVTQKGGGEREIGSSILLSRLAGLRRPSGVG